MTWELWSNDTFDRDSEPREEDSGSDVTDGAVAFWRKTLDEGTLEDGTASFTHFHVRLPGSLRVDLPDHPRRKHALHKLRRWRHEPDVVSAIGAFHATRFDRAGCASIFEAAAEAADAEALCVVLRGKSAPPASTISEDCLVMVHTLAAVLAAETGHTVDVSQIRPAPTGNGILFGDPSRPHLLLHAHPPGEVPEGTSRWDLSVEDLEDDGAKVRFAIQVEDSEADGRTQTFAATHGSALATRLTQAMREKLKK
jgi:hypothetical protein